MDVFAIEPFHMPIGEKDIRAIAMASECFNRIGWIASNGTDVGVGNSPPGSPGFSAIIVGSCVISVGGIRYERG